MQGIVLLRQSQGLPSIEQKVLYIGYIAAIEGVCKEDFTIGKAQQISLLPA